VGDDRAGRGRRWKVVLSPRGASDFVQSRLLLARLNGVSWYRRQGRLLVSVKVDASTQEEAERLAVELLGDAQVHASAVRSRHLLR